MATTWLDLEGKSWGELEGRTWSSLEALADTYDESIIMIRVQLNDAKEEEKKATGFRKAMAHEKVKRLNYIMRQLRDIRKLCKIYYTSPRDSYGVYLI